MNVNFELYKVFYHVAKTLSFSVAAQQLYISQSAVSQSIKLLEEKLNTKLFSRHTKLVQLTSEGKLLFEHIQQAYNFIRSGEKSIQDIHSFQQGEVRIGASDTICKYYLLPYFKQFHQNYPHIKIHITNRPSPVCIELLQKGELDIAIVNLPHQMAHKSIHSTKLTSIQDVFIGGPAFIHLKNKEISLQELKAYPILALEKNSTTRIFFDHLMEQQGLSIVPEFELGSIDLLIELTRIGLGIAFVMENAIKTQSEDIFILRIKEKIPTRDVGIITNESLPLSVAAQRFFDLLIS